MITRNTNVDTQDFRMNEIYNFNTGKIEQADYWLKQSPAVINKLKTAIQNNKKSYGCPFCKTPLVLKVGNKKHAHFSHVRRDDGVDCALCKVGERSERLCFVSPTKKKPTPHTWTSTPVYIGMPFFSSTATVDTYQAVKVSDFKASTSTYAATSFKEEGKEIDKDYASMSDKEVIKLIFENKLSRTLVGLKNRLSDLILEGYNLPKNLIEILELRGSIKKMTANLSQAHYQKTIFDS